MGASSVPWGTPDDTSEGELDLSFNLLLSVS